MNTPITLKQEINCRKNDSQKFSIINFSNWRGHFIKQLYQFKTQKYNFNLPLIMKYTAIKKLFEAISSLYTGLASTKNLGAYHASIHHKT